MSNLTLKQTTITDILYIDLPEYLYKNLVNPKFTEGWINKFKSIPVGTYGVSRNTSLMKTSAVKLARTLKTWVMDNTTRDGKLLPSINSLGSFLESGGTFSLWRHLVYNTTGLEWSKGQDNSVKLLVDIFLTQGVCQFGTDIKATKYQGCTVLPYRGLRDYITSLRQAEISEEFLNLTTEDLNYSLTELLKSGYLIEVKKGFFAVKSVYENEQKIGELANEIVQLNYNFKASDLEKLDESQKRAVVGILTTGPKVCTIYGEGGSGKSYTMSTLQKCLPANAAVIALTTTGKATEALRLNLVNTPVSTISYAKFKGIDLPEGNKEIFLVVDECSMLSNDFLYQLLKVIEDIPNLKKVILLGDKYQLAPVGIGSVFNDLIIRLAGKASFPLESQHRILNKETREGLNKLRKFKPANHFSSQEIEKEYFKDSVSNLSNGFGYTNLMGLKGFSIKPCMSFGAILFSINSHLDRLDVTNFSTHSNKVSSLVNLHIFREVLKNESRGHDLKKLEILHGDLDKAYGLLRGFSKDNWSDVDTVTPWATRKERYRQEAAFISGDTNKIPSYWRTGSGEFSGIVDFACRNFIKIDGARVMCTKNVYYRPRNPEDNEGIKNLETLEAIYNGQVYTVKGNTLIPYKHGGGTVEITEEAYNLFTPAFCTTTHKQQGSQNLKSIYIHMNYTTPCDLVYTALSRGQEENVLIGRVDWAGRGGSLQMNTSTPTTRVSSISFVDRF